MKQVDTLFEQAENRLTAMGFSARRRENEATFVPT